jgi:hypothetical protein
MSLRQEILKNSSRRRRKEIVIRILLGIGILGLLAAVAVFLFYIPSLRISNISISGLNADDETELRAEVFSAISSRKFLIIPEDHLIFFNKEKIKSLLAEKFRVKDYELETEFPSSLKISVTERKTWAIHCLASGKPCYLLDKDGLAFSQSPGFAGSAILKIIDAREEDFLGKNILPEESFGKIKYFIENISSRVEEEVSAVNIKSSGETYLLYVRSGWYALIDGESYAGAKF